MRALDFAGRRARIAVIKDITARVEAENMGYNYARAIWKKRLKRAKKEAQLAEAESPTPKRVRARVAQAKKAAAAAAT